MEILERLNDRIKGFASLANIGYKMYEVNLEGEVYKCARSRRSMRYRAECVGNKWKIYTRDASGRNCIEYVIPRNVLVGCAWYNIDEKIWENSTYANTIRRCKEFFSISNLDKDKTKYKTKNGFSYYVTKFGEVWNTETMTKVKGRVKNNGYRYVDLGSSVRDVAVHRLVAQHFVPEPKDLLEETLVVNHLDGNKLNNRSDNLEWTTQNGNMAHASSTGLLHTTIDDQLLERIWQFLQADYSDTDISRETSISVVSVSQIRRGTSRRYRTDKYTWPKSSVDARMKEPRDELAIKCVKMFNQGMSYQAIADKLCFNSTKPVRTLIGKYRDLITRKPRKLPCRLDKATIFSIYDDFVYTDKSSIEIGKQYNVSQQLISKLRLGHIRSNLAYEYITSKGLDGYWKGFRPPKK